jgi:hypothetical protein
MAMPQQSDRQLIGTPQGQSSTIRHPRNCEDKP